MTNYIIKRDVHKKTIIAKESKTIPYIIKPKLKKRTNMLDISEIYVLNSQLKSFICQKQFTKAFQRLMNIVYHVIDGSEDDADSMIALNEIEHAKLILLDEYVNYLSKQEIKKMLKKLNYLEEELKKYIMQINIRNNYLDYLNQNYENTKGKGR